MANGSYCGQCDGKREWCGACYEVLRGRAPGKATGKRGAAPFVTDSTGEPAPTEKRKKKPAQPAADQEPPQPWRGRYPTLWKLLTQGDETGGTLKANTTLLIVLDGGRVKLCLNDRPLGRSAWLTVRELPEGFGELEAALADGSLKWRRSKTPPAAR